jgi:hypothetical protein
VSPVPVPVLVPPPALIVRVPSSLSVGETMPGAAVPDHGDGGSDADWSKWIKSTFFSVAHPVGSAAMMKRSLGGT